MKIKLLLMFLTFLAVNNIFSKEAKSYDILVLPLYNLSYESNEEELENVLNGFIDQINKTEGYNLIHKKSADDILKKYRIQINSILLDDDLKNILIKTKVDFVMYNVFSVNENGQISIYNKIINKDKAVKSIEKTVRSESALRGFFNKTLIESIKLIENETKLKFAEVKEELPLPENKDSANDKKPVKSPDDKKSETADSGSKTKPEVKSKPVNPKDVELTKSASLFVPGLVLTSVGGAFLLQGGIVLAVDCFYYFEQVKLYRQMYKDESISYEEYLTKYYTNIGLFCGSMVSIGIGVLMMPVGGAMLLYNYISGLKPNPKTSFDIEKTGDDIKLAFVINLDNL